MPKYNYICEKCNMIRTLRRMVSKRDDPVLCADFGCSYKCKRLIEASETKVMELNDDFYHNKPTIKNIQMKLKKRSKDYEKKTMGEVVEKFGQKLVIKK